MKDIDRNCRTLIVCFVVAIFTLIPLRFYEVGNMMSSYAGQSEILGEYVSLPDSSVRAESRVLLERPYEEMENRVLGDGCMIQGEVDEKIGALVEALKTEGLDEGTVTLLIEEIERVENSVCR